MSKMGQYFYMLETVGGGNLDINEARSLGVSFDYRPLVDIAIEEGDILYDGDLYLTDRGKKQVNLINSDL